MNKEELQTNGQFSNPANWSTKLTGFPYYLNKTSRKRCISALNPFEINERWRIVLYEN